MIEKLLPEAAHDKLRNALLTLIPARRNERLAE